MEAIFLLRVNGEGEAEGYYEVHDALALDGLGELCKFKPDPELQSHTSELQSHTCFFPARMCAKKGWENCCCIPLGPIEWRVSCHN